MAYEEFEKEKQLIAFKEEIQKLISEAKEKAKKGEKKYNPHFAQMENVDSLTEEDMSWWEIINKEYKASDFKNKEEFETWYYDLFAKVKEYIPDKSSEKDRYLFSQEIKNRFSYNITGVLVEFE